MKYSDVLWVQNLARRSCGKPLPNPHSIQTINQAVGIFMDELCALMNDYSSTFNEIVKNERPEHAFRAFKLTSPRPGLMLLRGKDKLVISSEGARIRAKIVQVHAYNEKSLDVMDFDARITPENEIVWVCTNDSQRVNPELVAREYLGPFLAYGCQAFEKAVVRPRGAQNNVTDALEF